MAAIRSKDTKPEIIVRRGLWKRGFRYRLNHKRLPGHPDLVLRKYRTCIFVNGCFWHGHHINLQFDDLQFTISSSECCKIPKTNREFWVAKIRRNQERDKDEQRRLAEMGWHCNEDGRVHNAEVQFVNVAKAGDIYMEVNYEVEEESNGVKKTLFIDDYDAMDIEL
jgi:DNA mismatch endonuclease Vsr